MLAVPRFPLALAQITHAKMVHSLAPTFTRPILQLNVIITDHGRPQVNKRLLPHRHYLLQVSLFSLVSETWEKCYSLSERFCFDPPTPPYNGGEYNWNTAFVGGLTPYNTLVTYTCGLGRRLANYTDNDIIFYDSIDLRCEWDRTWSPNGPVRIW